MPLGSSTATGPRRPEFRLGETYRACSSPDRAFGSGPKGSRFESCQAHLPRSAVFLQHALDQAIEALGLVVDVGGQHTHAFVVCAVRFVYLLAQSLYPAQRRLELTVQSGAGCLDVGQHLEELPALENHVDREEDGKGRRARRTDAVSGVP